MATPLINHTFKLPRLSTCIGEDMDTDEVPNEDEDEMETGNDEKNSKVYLPGQQNEEETEELVHDRSAYYMYHKAQTGAPCLSFDVLRDSLGERREEYPLTLYLVAGTQSEKGKQNFVILMKMSQICSTYKEGQQDDDDDESDSDDEEDDPQLDTIMIQHPSVINRIRVAPLTSNTIVATWSEVGKVYLWDVTKHSILLDSPSTGATTSAAAYKGHKDPPLFTFNGHHVEGYALDWSTTVIGKLATGDTRGHIHLWNPHEGGTWTVSSQPYTAHTESVEDIQWSPNESTVFSSCSVDRTIRIWDCRAAPTKACMITAHAHEADVNVIHWNRTEPFILSGGDDGIIKVWDLRQIKNDRPSAVFNHHNGPVTSVQWNPFDSTVFASAGGDDQIVQWDLAVERDEETGEGEGEELKDVPQQLLFIHQEIKELHWHPQLPGVVISTALSGFNVFRTISV